MERDYIDYLAHEQGIYHPTSYNGYLKELIQGCRFVRSQVPANEIRSHMPPLWVVEEKLQDHDAEIGIDKIPYIDEIFEVLNKETAAYRYRKFIVSEITINDFQEISQLISKDEQLATREQAEDWIAVFGQPGKVYEIREFYYKY